MKNFAVFLFLIFAVHFNAQNQRFTYEYSFKIDSLDRNTISKEIMNLDITKEGSNFYSALLLASDSLLKAEFEKGKVSQAIHIDMTKVKKAKVNFWVSKNYPSLETIYHTSISASKVAIKETQKLDWTVLPETKNIEGFKVQKASTTFGGRNWTIWFTNDIQIQDGPYKFCGLPGLILNISDEKGDHVFNLIGSKKASELPFVIKSSRNETLVTTEKFIKLWNEHKKDPAKNIKQIHSSSEMSDTIFYDNNSGSPLTKQDLIRRKEQGAFETFRKVNNFLELDLYR